ncbi:MAG: GT2 family glycosyltransferase [Planctomycetota bacterium]|jgi:GT2 family glycosyltransferase
MSVDLSIVIVNFNTAHFLFPLMDSILNQEWSIDGRPGTCEVIVVDNASKGEDAAMVLPLKKQGMHYIQNTMNVGYGQANNQGFAVATGRYHMILNPDCCFLPGCFQALIDHLETHPGSTMVGPLAFMDPEATCMMPPNEMPTPELFEFQTRAQVETDCATQNLVQRTKFAYEYWAAKEPLEMEMLSGSCLVFRRSLFADEHPFDPGFPLYYEDTDMFMRLRRAGKKLMHIPTARMLHYWSQSADGHARGAEYRHQISANRYYLKHFGEAGVETYRSNLALSLEYRERGQHVSPFEFQEIEAGAEPPTFHVAEGHENFFVEFAGNPIFTLAVGMFPTEPSSFTVSPVMWQQIGPGNYWIRIIDCDTLQTVHAWVITKKP